MKFLNKIAIIIICNSVCCNASSLLNNCDNTSNISDDLFNEIKKFIDNDEFISNSNKFGHHRCTNSNDSELSSNGSINKYSFINLNNINWSNNSYNNNLTSEYNTNNKILIDNKQNNKIHKINNKKELVIQKTNELIKFCPAFEYGIEKIENMLNRINANLFLKNSIQDVDISDALRTIIIYHELLDNMSNYYALRHINKNRISNDFKKIANKFIKKSQDFCNKINNLINKKEHVNFAEKHKDILEHLFKAINNEHDFLK